MGGEGGSLLDSVDLSEAMFAEGASSGLMAGLFTSGIALPHTAASGDQDPIPRFLRPPLAGEAIAEAHRLAAYSPDAYVLTKQSLRAATLQRVREGGAADLARFAVEPPG